MVTINIEKVEEVKVVLRQNKEVICIDNTTHRQKSSGPFVCHIDCRQRIKLDVLMMTKVHMRLKALFKTKKLKIFKMDDQDSL